MNLMSNYLGVPPGTHIRKAGQTDVTGDQMENDYISTILDITTDDICIGNSPLSFESKYIMPDKVNEHVTSICDSLNGVLRWVARDLCSIGYSVYDTVVSKKSGKLLLFPYLKPVEFYMDDEGEILIYDVGDKKKCNLDNKLFFINYDKSSFVEVDKMNEDATLPKNIKFLVNPVPMQMKSCKRTIKYITLGENALARYRTQLSRIARFVTVDVGASQGDKQQEIVDSISSAINADSMSLNMGDDSETEYEDGLPVVPHRHGIGQPDLKQDIPNYNLKDLGDLDYWLNKLTLLMRFPATYMDFTKNIDSSVATTLRGDLRYARLCESVRTKIEDTINKYFNSSEKFKRYGIHFIMAVAPTTEDADIIDTLSEFVSGTNGLYGFVMGDGEEEPVQSKLDRLELLSHIFLGTCSNKRITEWFSKMRTILERMKEEEYKNGSPAVLEGDDMMEDMGGDDFSDLENVEGMDNLGTDAESLDNIGNSEPTGMQAGVETFDLGPGE